MHISIILSASERENKMVSMMPIGYDNMELGSDLSKLSLSTKWSGVEARLK